MSNLINSKVASNPTLNRVLNKFGLALNQLGLPYATGLTRDRATLFSATRGEEISGARERLLASGRDRALWAIEDYDRMQLGLPKRTPIEKFQHFWFGITPRDGSCEVYGMGVGGKGIKGGDPVLQLIMKYGSLAKIAQNPEAVNGLEALGKKIFESEKGYTITDISKPIMTIKVGEEFLDAATTATISHTLQTDVETLAKITRGKITVKDLALSLEKILEIEGVPGPKPLIEIASQITESTETANFSPWMVKRLFEALEGLPSYGGDLTGVLTSLPAAIKSMANVRMSADHILSFTRRVLNYTEATEVENYSDMITTVLTAVPKIFSAIVNRDYSPDKVANAIVGIMEDQGYQMFGNQIVAALPSAIKAGMPIQSFVEDCNSFLNAFCGLDRDGGENILKAIPVLFDLGYKDMDQIGGFLDKLRGTSKEDVSTTVPSFVALFSNLHLPDDAARDAALSRFFSMLDALNEFNREPVLRLFDENQAVFEKIGPRDFLAHFNLYMEVLIGYKRLGYSVLDGILDAEKDGSIGQVLTLEESRKIKEFVSLTNSFTPVVYKAFKVEGPAVLEDFKPLAEKIINDGLGQDDIDAIVKKYEKYDGLEFLFAIIQTVIPLSGASFVKRDQGKALLEKMMRAGDLREHVPANVRGMVKSIALEGKEPALGEGETIDMDMISPILSGLRGKKKIEISELHSAVKAYLLSDRNEGEKEKLRQSLYTYAAREDLLGEKVDRLGSKDYYTLRLLEELFQDPECLPAILRHGIGHIDPDLLTGEKTSLQGSEGMIKAINKMWQGSGNEKVKAKRLAAMTDKYQKEDLQAMVASGKLLPAAAAELSRLIGLEQEKYLSPEKLVEEILHGPLQAIRREKAKYLFIATGDSIKLGLRAVKGMPYGVWGLSAGVCIGTDQELWADPNFKLISMIDERTNNVVGFVHVYETTVDGKKAWTLPGIEPTTEFIGTVKASELYDKTIAAVVELAEAAGAQAVYIPTSPTIHSNRSDIGRVIAAKKYPKRTIPEVKWSRSPAYPFSEVFIVNEK